MKKKRNSKQFNKQFRKRFFTRKSMTIIILTLVIILFLGIGGIRQKQKADHYKRSIEELSSEVKQIEDTNRALEEEKKETDTDAFKERVAREKLGLIKKDEYAIKESDEADSSKSSKSSGKKKSK